MADILATPPPVARLTLERAEELRIVGWAVAADGGAAAVRLSAAGTELPAVVRRIERPDVRAALGLRAEVPYGFEIDLPASVWRHVDAEGRLAMRLTAEGRAEALALTMDIEKLASWIRALPKASGAANGLGSDDMPAHLGALYRSAWWARLALDDATQSRLFGPSEAPRLRVRGHVEAVEGLIIKGWALGRGDGERFSLVCAGEPVDCEIVRVERDDVRRATGTRRLALGFEIRPAGWFWRLVPGQDSAELRVQVDGVELESSGAVLSKDAVREAVRSMRSDVFDPANASEAQRAERQFRELWLLEHVASAAVLESLERDDARYIVNLAERFGVSSILADDRQQDDLAQAAASSDPVAVPTLWRLLRLTNEALAVPDASLIDAAEHALQATGVQGVQRNRFLATLVPFFCDKGGLDEFLSWLAPSAIAEMAAAEGRWELSIAVAVRAAQCDFIAVAELLRRLRRTAAQDWLNTGCLLDATRRLLRAAEEAKISAALFESSVDMLLGLIDEMAGNPASRLHDRHLMTLTSEVVAESARFDATLARRAEAVALRAYGLVPDFWRTTDTGEGPAPSGSAEVDAARPLSAAVFAALRRCDELSSAELAQTVLHLQRFQAWRNPDAEVLLRQLLVALAIRRDEWREEEAAVAKAAIGLLPEADSIRFPAMPLAADHALRTPRPDLLDVLRRASDVPMNANRRLEAEAVSSQHMLLKAVRDESGAAAVVERFRALRALALPLAGRRDDFVGVDLITTGALLVRDASPEDAVVLEDLRAVMKEAFGECASRRDERLPAALAVALSRLAQSRRRSPFDTALADLVDDLHRTIEHWMPSRFDDVPPSTPLALGQPDRVHSTLVAIFSCRERLATRIAAIREGWWKPLRAEGVVCIVVTGGATNVPLLEGDVLSLPVADDPESLPQKTIALIEWVVEKTDFEHLLKIDDDCHLEAARFLDNAWHVRHHYVGRPVNLAAERTGRLGHRRRFSSARGRFAIDKSPDSSSYADGATGYVLSRFAMHRALEVHNGTGGSKRMRNAFFEDKLLGDLLASRGIVVRGDEHHAYVRRRFGDDAVVVGAFGNAFFPGPSSPTLITHLGEENAPERPVPLEADSGALQPARIWPLFSAPRIGDAPDINQLELLSSVERVASLRDARVVLVAVARNENTMLPHFLAHYRGIGIRSFIFVDNLSDDGTRERLVDENDVVTYSVDTQYRNSRYGVTWQEVVMSHHCLGKWVLLADVDEFLVDRHGTAGSIDAIVDSLDAEKADAARIGMIDLYPATPLAEADLHEGPPFETCGFREATPLIEWRLGSGSFSNSTTWLSALRHRLLPDSAPNYYTSQKVALLRYMPWVRFSEGLHYAAGLRLSEHPLAFAHFKYHSGFRSKVLDEVRRKQHYSDAQEYTKYRGILREASSTLYDRAISRRVDAGGPLFPADATDAAT